MQFSSERLHYRLLEEQDRETFIALYQNDHVMQFISKPLTEVEALRFFDDLLVKKTKVHRSSYTFTIISKTTAEVVGFMMLRIAKKHSAEVGIVIAPEAENTGVATESFHKLTSFAIEHLGIVSFYAECNQANRSVRRMLAKVGFDTSNIANKSENGFYTAVFSV